MRGLSEHKAKRNGLADSGVPLAISTRDRTGPKPWRGQCPRHGGHITLDVDPTEFGLTHDGIDFTLARDDYALSFCSDCFEDIRTSFNNDLHRDADPETIAKHVCRDRWKDVKRGFEASYLAEAGEVTHCPFCGEQLASVAGHGTHHDDATKATCSEHGPLSLRIAQERDPTDPEELEA